MTFLPRHVKKMEMLLFILPFEIFCLFSMIINRNNGLE